MSVKRYAEVIANHTTAKNILTGQQVDLTKDVPMADRAVMVLEF